MKFAFMSFSCPQATLSEMLSLARKYGYQGVEPRAQAQHRHGVEIEAKSHQRQEIRKIFADSDIECACIATSLRYCLADKKARQEMIDQTRYFLELAHDIGCKRIRVFGGKPDVEMDKQKAVEIVGEALSEVAPAAEAADVKVCLETHDFFSRADMASQAVRKANNPFIRVNWDIMHPFTQGMSIDEAFAEVKDLVSHCHIHDGTYDAERKVTLALMGQGEIPYARAVQLLAGINYQGYLSGEYIKMWPPEVVLPHDLAVLKSYLPQTREIR